MTQEIHRMVSPEAGVVRKYIARSIGNSHAAAKSCWVIMFSAGTFAALSALNLALRCDGLFNGSTVVACPNPSDSFLLFKTSVSLFIFVLTFSRFYLGDVRVFDEKYSEVHELVRDKIDAGDKSREQDGGAELKNALLLFSKLLSYNDTTWLKFESVWLIFQTMIIVFLAFQLAEATNFLIVYATLLVCNSIWLTATNVLVEHTISDAHREVFDFYRGDRGFMARYPHLASWRWTINNMFHFIALVLIILIQHGAIGSTFIGITVSEETLMVAGYVVCISNCVIDFTITRDFYFPKFSEFYRTFQESIESKQTS
jgi:hypothetical protein